MSRGREGQGQSMRTVAPGMFVLVVRWLSLGLVTSGHPFSGFLVCCPWSGSEAGHGAMLGPAASDGVLVRLVSLSSD